MASESGRPDGRNDDWAGATASGIAVVLDGLTEDGPTGCVHGTGWFVHQLGTRLLGLAAAPDRALSDVLAAAIDDVRRWHGADCDLGHPGSPAATVAMLRARGGGTLEYLVLCDAVAVLDQGAEPTVVTDRRAQDQLADLALTAVRSPSPVTISALIQAQQRIRNRPGGYWVAQHDPEAALHALTGVAEGARGALLLSDGAALLATEFGAMTWRELIEVAYERGPGDVIAATREIERRDADRSIWPRFKIHDDATIVAYQI